MKIKKIIAAVAATAVAVSAMAVNVFASEPVQKPESYENPPLLLSADESLPDSLFGPDVEVTINLTVNNMNGGWANGAAGIVADGAMDEASTIKFGGKECDAEGNRSWFPEGSVVIADDQTSATVVCKADLTGKSSFNIYIFSGQPTDADNNGFFDIESVTIKNAAGFSATYADGKLTVAGGDAGAGAPAGDGDTTSQKTGNVPAAAMVSVMALAGVAAAASKKRK